jgi:hypothetical protein
MKRIANVSLALVLCIVAVMVAASQASAAVKVRVQPSGPDISSAYVITGETRTYFGNAENSMSGTYEYKWEFSNGGDTAWADTASPWYINIDHVFGSAGLNWARLTVRDKANTGDTDSETIEVMVLSVDTANRQKNSAVDRGLHRLYLNTKADASGSYWDNGGYPVASTAMALIAFENHRHNLEASDDDIFKKNVQGGLQWLFNQAYEVELSDQPCIGDPEADDGDTDNNGYGIAFNCWSEGYEVPLAMLAIINSCSKATAQTLTASSSSSTFVDGRTYWDIMVDAKDFLAYAQSDGVSSSFYNECYGPTASSFFSVDQESGPGFWFYSNFNVNAVPSWDSCSRYEYSVGNYYLYFYYERSGNTFNFEPYVYDYNGSIDCQNAQFRIVYGDDSEETFAPNYCEPYVAYFWPRSHTYSPQATPYTATAYFSNDNGASWIEICSLEILVPIIPNCDQMLIQFDYGDGTETSLGYCDGNGYAELNIFHSYGTTGTYTARASYSIDGGDSWNETCIIDVTYEDIACSPTGDGWRYSRNYTDTDNSVSQWPTLALEEARREWGININPLVIERFKKWLAYSQGPDSGGFGYTSPGNWENFSKTGAGLAMLKWAGYGLADTSVQKALSYLDTNWDWLGSDGNLGNFYGMYAFYKGMKYLGLTALGAHNWEDSYRDYLTAVQNPDGSWDALGGWVVGPDFSTGVALAMLAPAVGGLPPVADAGGPYGPINPNQPVTLDGTGSFHQDLTRNIVKHEWDYDAADGLWWDAKAAPDAAEGAIADVVTTSYPDMGSETSYTVTLRVTDDSDPEKTDTDTSTVTVRSGNVPPVAVTNGPWAGLPGEAIRFDAGSSYDPNSCTTPGDPSCLDDAIAAYEWDLDGDGLFNESNGDDGSPVIAGDYSVVEKSFAEPTSQIVTLIVTDKYGLYSSSSPNLNIVSIALVYAWDYRYCFSKTINRFEARNGLQVTFKNIGTGTAENVVMKLVKTPTNITVNKGAFTVGSPLGPEEEVTSLCDAAIPSADFEVTLNSRIRPPSGQWQWKAEFDFNGKHYIIDNLPPLAP